LVSWSPRPARGLVFDRYTQQRPEVMIVPDIGPVPDVEPRGETGG
jgi:hypothetical protein